MGGAALSRSPFFPTLAARNGIFPLLPRFRGRGIHVQNISGTRDGPEDVTWVFTPFFGLSDDLANRNVHYLLADFNPDALAEALRRLLR